MTKVERYTPLIGRCLLALIFLISGLGKIAAWGQTAAMMDAEGMPLIPFFLVAAILFELIGGLSLLLGYRARVGALALIVYLIPVTLIFHDFWKFQGMEQQVQLVNFLKNLAIIGGLLLVVAYGAGPYSLDRRREPGVA